VSVEKAEKLLGFTPKNTIADDIEWYYSDNYVAQGGLDKDVAFGDDSVVLGAALASK